MSSTSESRNERALEAARRAGQATYRREVIDLCPACTECGGTIRWVGRGPNNADGYPKPGDWRRCDCPGVFWTYSALSWRRYEPAAEEST